MDAATLPVEIGVVSRPHRGFEVNGDGWWTQVTPERVCIMVIDGLGHGEPAAESAQLGVRVVQESDWSDLNHTLRRCHNALRGTRGAAVSLARLDLVEERLLYCGVGNIEARLVGRQSTRPVAYSGIVGAVLPNFRVFTLPWHRGDTLFMHSDGISARFNLNAYPDLTAVPTQLIAEAVARDWARDTDDAILVVARWNGAPS